MYVTKTPDLFFPFSRDFLWRVNTANEKKIFLTFDDGPTPEVTEQTLQLLASFDAKATFFCLGKNVIRHPELVQSIYTSGHAIGNHSFSHPNGWKTRNYPYIKDVLQAAAVIPSLLFRPPYGRIRRGQAIRLKYRFRIVMWSIITGDFDVSRSAQQCGEAAIKHAAPGSIIVFHDSEKARKNMLPALEQSLHALAAMGYAFCALEEPTDFLSLKKSVPTHV